MADQQTILVCGPANRAAELKYISPKAEYKHLRHIERYDRWAAKIGRSAHIESKSEVGSFAGIRWSNG